MQLVKVFNNNIICVARSNEQLYIVSILYSHIIAGRRIRLRCAISIYYLNSEQKKKKIK